MAASRGEGDGVDRVTGLKKLRLLTIGAAVNTFLFKGIKIKTLILSAQDKVYMRTRCTKKNWGLALLARSTRKKKIYIFFQQPTACASQQNKIKEKKKQINNNNNNNNIPILVD